MINMEDSEKNYNNIIETGFNLYFLYIQSFMDGSEQGEDIAEVEEEDNLLENNLVGKTFGLLLKIVKTSVKIAADTT